MPNLASRSGIHARSRAHDRQWSGGEASANRSSTSLSRRTTRSAGNRPCPSTSRAIHASTALELATTSINIACALIMVAPPSARPHRDHRRGLSSGPGARLGPAHRTPALTARGTSRFARRWRAAGDTPGPRADTTGRRPPPTRSASSRRAAAPTRSRLQAQLTVRSAPRRGGTDRFQRRQSVEWRCPRDEGGHAQENKHAARFSKGQATRLGFRMVARPPARRRSSAKWPFSTPTAAPSPARAAVQQGRSSAPKRWGRWGE